MRTIPFQPSNHLIVIAYFALLVLFIQDPAKTVSLHQKPQGGFTGIGGHSEAPAETMEELKELERMYRRFGPDGDKAGGVDLSAMSLVDAKAYQAKIDELTDQAVKKLAPKLPMPLRARYEFRKPVLVMTDEAETGLPYKKKVRLNAIESLIKLRHLRELTSSVKISGPQYDLFTELENIAKDLRQDKLSPEALGGISVRIQNLADKLKRERDRFPAEGGILIIELDRNMRLLRKSGWGRVLNGDSHKFCINVMQEIVFDLIFLEQSPAQGPIEDLKPMFDLPRFSPKYAPLKPNSKSLPEIL